ncbi:hypothetical protein LSUE1_G006337 [Lachnellula suecica]|uniref:Uncharacterized protein n=1 Tax=Lachnellula suecica TaxID=602035 RepID=A0A8T9CD91_9HELO|nr:hypothetical protein LSUE1_G006337 [Lachnellula suecica]
MYSIPEEAQKVFQHGILSNPLISGNLPVGYEEHGKKIKFEGENAPSMPINWRFAESISAIKTLEATFVLALLEKKYNCQPHEIVFNTQVSAFHDYAQLFVMSTLLWEIDPAGAKGTPLNAIIDAQRAKLLYNWFPSFDHHRLQGTYHRASCSNIYKTKDEDFSTCTVTPDRSVQFQATR